MNGGDCMPRAVIVGEKAPTHARGGKKEEGKAAQRTPCQNAGPCSADEFGEGNRRPEQKADLCAGAEKGWPPPAELRPKIRQAPKCATSQRGGSNKYNSDRRAAKGGSLARPQGPGTSDLKKRRKR